MRFNDFKRISEAQFNSKQEVIDHFVKQGKSAAAGASAWERGWRGTSPKAKKPTGPVRSYHDDLDDKRYGETNEALNEHKKGVRAHKYTKKAKGTVSHLDAKKDTTGRKLVGPAKVKQLEKDLQEAALGVAPKRPSRPGSRPGRGHAEESRYKVSKKAEPVCEFCGSHDHTSLDESGKASRSLCVSSKADSDLGASQLASCKSQGLRDRKGEKSHKIGKNRVAVGGKRIKGKAYGGPLPDWSEE